MTFFYITTFVIGLCFGSFTSVIIHRLRTNKGSIIWSRSRCPKCKHVLRPTDLIPLVSYLTHKGKCRYCKKKIPNRYPIIELTMGAFFVLTTIMVGPGSFCLLAYYLAVTFVFVLLSFYDIFYQEVPDEISLPTILFVGLVAHIAHLHPIGSLWIGFAIPVLFFSALFFGSQGRWLGGGDIRIGAIMGFLLGWPNILVALFLAYFIGALFSLYGLATKKYTKKSPIPFGPFLFLGAYIALFWGTDLINWYMRWT